MKPTVLIIGAGLLGASIGRALVDAGLRVHISDADRTHAIVAASRGAGIVADPIADDVGLVIVAVPPLAIPDVVVDALERYPNAIVTDVGSVKASVITKIEESGIDLARYVGSHPMAGTQFAGPITAAPDLFRGRTWVITPTSHNPAWAVDRVVVMAQTCGAETKIMKASDHDRAVAEISHLPQIMASLTAALLGSVPRDDLTLAGTGIRDVTRIAASDPKLWRQIITSNKEQIQHLLQQVRSELDQLISSLDDGAAVEALIAKGRRNVRLLPGKHGRRNRAMQSVIVEIPDAPGALARLFAQIDAQGVNIEDLAIEHDPNHEIGYLAVQVEVGKAQALREAMIENGWHVRALSVEEETVVENDATNLVIAIDGPSGSGKSSTARGVATELNLGYLDTGAMYRAVTWGAMHSGVDLDDGAALVEYAKNARLKVSTDSVNPMFFIDGNDVTSAIREPAVTEKVSKIATKQAVRDLLTNQMRELILEVGRIVVEGRDITTVVAPDADVKVLLVADPRARMDRRNNELEQKLSAEQLEDQILRRDRDDSTMSEFEKPAEGVTLIDSTYLSLAEVIAAVIALVPED